MILGRVALLLGWPAALAAAETPTAAIRWAIAAPTAAIEVTGLAAAELRRLGERAAEDPSWPQVLAVYAEQGAAAGLPAMAGKWRIADGVLRFEPQFPPARGVRYRAEYRPAGGDPVVAYFELPGQLPPPSTTVVQIYPTADELPENQLKFYVQFSAPMSRGDVYTHIQIRTAGGTPVELAFLELDEELWDPTMTRLTLLIDPGRIKRGVQPLEEVGPVFEAGKSYTLVIGTGCRDASGRPLLAGVEKRIKILGPDRLPPDPARWKIAAPAAGTRAPLVVDFDEPMDQALALRLIGVAADGTGPGTRAGEAALSDRERRWQFVPDAAWSRGRHRLVVTTTIEDLAGNNIGKAFDVDRFERVNRRVAAESVTVEFEVKE